jgi:ribosomal protein S18 acetylase RimI-like enzyme
MLQHFAAGTSTVVEVNTQEDNVAAIALYNSLDFELTGEHAQVWHCELNR